MNSDGDVLRRSRRSPTPSGDDVQLTLNAHVQRMAQTGAPRRHATRPQSITIQNGNLLRANAGAVIVMDPTPAGS